ncbi:MAG TPA: energy transducer TonB [Candidatus Aquilonibacter sp.]|nr:energy transducer TonB [Candidatus Aquilonibacter sp.]
MLQARRVWHLTLAGAATLAQRPQLDPNEKNWVRSALAQKQPRRLLAALILLLVALTLVVIKDREFWFGPDESAEAESPVQPVSAPSAKPAENPTSAPAASAAATAAPAAPVKKVTAKAAAEKSPAATSAPANASIVASNRTVLPPLAVEVIAGDSHRAVRPGSNAIKVEIPGSGNNSTTVSAGSGPATNLAELQRISPGIATTIDQAGNAYPLLAQRARVEGSVVLEALIGADGVIRNLRVLSGPSILAPAAQEAVRQWRFRPYLQNGQPVETRANITVNFTIKVADSSKIS